MWVKSREDTYRPEKHLFFKQQGAQITGVMKLHYLDRDSGSAADQLFHSTNVLFPPRGENTTAILLICAL